MHVSYSEIKLWNECSHKHKLQYIDKIDGFKGNLHTAFGTAIHSVCERALLDGNLDREECFVSAFAEELDSLKSKEVEIDEVLLEQMLGQYEPIITHFKEELYDYFGDFELISTEEKLYEDIEGQDLKFKGFIDLIVKTPDGKYHILDWKTTGWGWDSRKKADKIINYQLTLYKIFWALKNDIPLNMIETHFGLLKRTAKKNNIEIFRATSGPIKIRNALTFLERAVMNIKRSFSIKNRLSCKYCDFYKTEHCT